MLSLHQQVTKHVFPEEEERSCPKVPELETSSTAGTRQHQEAAATYCLVVLPDNVFNKLRQPPGTLEGQVPHHLVSVIQLLF